MISGAHKRFECRRLRIFPQNTRVPPFVQRALTFGRFKNMDFALEFFPSAPTLRDVCTCLFLKRTMDPPRWRLANSTRTTMTISRLLYCAHAIIDNGSLLRWSPRVECWRICASRRVRMYIPERAKSENVSPVLRATYDASDAIRFWHAAIKTPVSLAISRRAHFIALYVYTQTLPQPLVYDRKVRVRVFYGFRLRSANPQTISVVKNHCGRIVETGKGISVR